MKISPIQIRHFPKRKEILLLLDTSRYLGRSILAGIQEYNRTHEGWNLFLWEWNMQDELPEWFEQWSGDGIISRCGDTKRGTRLRKKGVPVIELAGDGHKYRPAVRGDVQAISQMAADHFWQRGFRNFAFFTIGRNWWTPEYRDTFKASIQRSDTIFYDAPRLGQKTDSSLSILWEPDLSRQIDQWLRKIPKPTGIFCPRDLHALFLMNLCRQSGISIPEEVALLGYGNNSDMCRGCQPALSSIAPNGRDIGFQAAHLLSESFKGKPLPDKPILISPSHLVARTSTEHIAVDNPRVRQAIRFIRENITQNPTVTEIARYCSISRHTLRRLFQKETGHSPQQEILYWRMNFARELVIDTDLSMTQIAKQLEFSSVSCFVRAFRDRFKITPLAWRTRFHT